MIDANDDAGVQTEPPPVAITDGLLTVSTTGTAPKPPRSNRLRARLAGAGRAHSAGEALVELFAAMMLLSFMF